MELQFCSFELGDKRFWDYVCINAVIVMCKSFVLAIIDLTPARKRKLGVVKSCRDYNTPNFCNLCVPINRNTVVVLLSCNFPNHAVHTDRLSAG